MPCKPFLRWVGGKGKLLEQLRPLLPADIAQRRYVEPFVGGGALFFNLEPQKALLADVNRNLIEAYRAVRDLPDDVLMYLGELAAKHKKLPVPTYYFARERFNNTERDPMLRAKHAATFIYLNKTNYNGLYRTNRKGEYNVPLGAQKNPNVCDRTAIWSASASLKQAVIEHVSFKSLADQITPLDFLYIDPPYAPRTDTADFTSYSVGGFTENDQHALTAWCRQLNDAGVKFMLSQSDVPLVRELYAGFDMSNVIAKRSINSDTLGRSSISELVIRNYAT